MGPPGVEDQTVLVTGGAGFIGSHLVEALLPANEVRVLDDFSTGRRDRIPSTAAVIPGDLRDEAPLRDAMDGVDLVFHQAARVSVPGSIEDPVGSHAVNAGGTLAVLERARTERARVVVASSAAVYGDPVRLPVEESHPKEPTSPYGLGKLAADGYARLYADLYDLATVVLRYFNVYGPRQSGAYVGVVSTFIDRARRGDPLVIEGDGEQYRDFVHVDDVVRANLLAATTESTGEAFNVGSGEATTINELAELVVDLTDGEVPIQEAPPREGDIERSRAGLSKASELLGFEPTVGLRDGLATLVSTREAPD